MKRQEAEARGRWGERRAAWWLRLHGWRLLAERVKVKSGEIDLIMRRGKMVAFIEVKTRAKVEELDFAVDEFRLRRVAAAAEAVAHNYMLEGDDMRIDVVLVAPKTRPRHLPNVWMG